MSHSLWLHQELMLLSLRDIEGTAVPTMYNYAIGGALLSELLLACRVEVEPDGKSPVSLVENRPLQNDLLDDCLQMINEARRPKTMQQWIYSFGVIKRLKHRVARELCEMGVLRESEKRVLWLFKQKIYPEVDPKPELEIKSRLEKLIFSPAPELDERTLILASLAINAKLLKYNFDRRRLKQHKARIQSIAKGEMIGVATSQTIMQVQAAITAASVIPTITTTATNH